MERCEKLTAELQVFDIDWEITSISKFFWLCWVFMWWFQLCWRYVPIESASGREKANMYTCLEAVPVVGFVGIEQAKCPKACHEVSISFWCCCHVKVFLFSLIITRNLWFSCFYLFLYPWLASPGVLTRLWDWIKIWWRILNCAGFARMFTNWILDQFCYLISYSGATGLDCCMLFILIICWIGSDPERWDLALCLLHWNCYGCKPVPTSPFCASSRFTSS